MKKTVKKALSIALALMMMLGVLPFAPAVNATESTANFITNYEIDGDYVDVTLTFKDCAGLRFLDMKVIYDESELICDSVNQSSDFAYKYLNTDEAVWAYNTSYAGQILMGLTFMDELKEDELEFCTIRFQIIGDFTETVIRLEDRDNLTTLLHSLVITKPSEPTVCKHEDLNKDYLCDKCSEIVLGDDTDIVLENSVIFSKDKKTLISYLGTEKEYTVPESVEIIADRAFYNNATLEKINISGNIKKIGNEAFSNCTALTEFTIPQTITDISYATFAGCTALKEIEIPETIASIGAYAFGSCSSIKEITIPNNVTTIGEAAFSDCSSLKKVELSNKLTEIADDLLWCCTSLEKITIPENVTIIGDGAFYDCNMLSEINFNSKIKTIEAVAFANTSLEAVKLPGSVINIEQGAFMGCSKLSSLTLNEGLKRIASYVFCSCEALTEVSIPESVEYIGHQAFEYCENLEKITLPDSLADMETNAFTYTAHYNNKANWKNGAYYIGNHFVAFDKNTTVNGKYEVREGTKFILDNVLYDQKNLTELTIPDGVTAIGEMAFSLTSISEVTIPSSITSIEYGAFMRCYDLNEINLPDKLIRMSAYAFRSTEYYNNAENWEDNVLYMNRLLVDAKETYYDYYTGQLTTDELTGSYSVKDGTIYIAKSAFDSSQVSEVILPESVLYIDDAAFRYCSNLKEITIPVSVTNIGSAAFHGSSLEKITILNPDTEIAGGLHKNFGWDSFLYSGKTIPSYVEIHGYKGSTAETYAIANGNKFVELTEPVPEISHQHNYTAVVTAPTCTKRGFTTYTCACGANYTANYVSANGHSHKAKVTAPTCTKQGFTTYTCACGDTYVADYVKAKGHSHKAKVTAPTCTKQGFTTYTCACGDTYVADYVKAKGHSYTAKVTTPATSEKEGVMTYTCACGDSYTKAIDKLPPAKIEYTATDSFKQADEASVMTLSGTKIEDVLKNVNEGARIVDEKGEAVKEDAVIRSGLKIQLTDESGKVVDEITVVVPGDVESDGRVNAKDARMALRASVELETLNDWQTSAANADTENNKITAKDARFILRASVELENFGTWLKNY